MLILATVKPRYNAPPFNIIPPIEQKKFGRVIIAFRLLNVPIVILFPAEGIRGTDHEPVNNALQRTDTIAYHTASLQLKRNSSKENG